MQITESSRDASATKKSSARFAMAAVSMAATMVCGSAGAQGKSPGAAQESYAAGRILVMPRAGLPDAALDKILNENGGGKHRRVGKSELRVVDLPPGLEKQLVEKLARHPHVKFAELDMIVEPDLATNDPYLGSQWHIPRIGADRAWDSASGNNVTIAILDTGVDSAHPDLSARIVAGWNVYDNNSNTADVYGHGTKVAGTAAAAFNNGLGVAGVAGTARIMPIRISSTTGSAAYSAMASGLTWAADHGARVANISYRAAGSSSVNSAASYMKSKGGLVVSSAGNNGVDEGFAQTTSMIPVSATNGSDVKTSWSSYGAFIALTAPGEGIHTTTSGGGYGSVSGTSFSSPITAGVAAIVMSANPKLSSAEVEKLLFSTAVDLGAAGRDSYYGYGLINASAAVNAAMTTTSTTDTSVPTTSISAPLGSSTVGGLVAVNVVATDNVGVTKVELRVNGGLVGTDTSAPYAFSWDSTTVTNGMAGLVAMAYDAAGNAGQSTAVTVNVSNNVVADITPPVVAVSNPTNGSLVSGMVKVKVSATDNQNPSGIVQILYIDGQQVVSTTGGLLDYSWNTRKLSKGIHTIQAVARDAAGNSSSQSISVNR